MTQFYKYQGTGNDFIIMDNRDKSIQLTKKQVAHLCDRKFGIGADGLMLLQKKESFDFEMIYYNADGGESSMCGNGGRCLVQFAYDIGIKKVNYSFIATDGPHEANFGNEGWVNLKMKNVNKVNEDGENYILNTGSPHFITFCNEVEKVNVFAKGQEIRNSKDYAAQGINVNFVEALSENEIYVRTYERGVENETSSCGTGVTAAALVSAHNDLGFNAINIKTVGGNLRVEYDKIDDEHFENIWLCGPATFVYKGNIAID
jgi:diaminopimelate epimerase